jgi:hypothetical protein
MVSPVFAKLTAAWISAADPLWALITAALAQVLKPPKTRAIPNVQDRARLLRLVVLSTLEIFVSMCFVMERLAPIMDVCSAAQPGQIRLPVPIWLQVQFFLTRGRAYVIPPSPQVNQLVDRV